MTGARSQELRPFTDVPTIDHMDYHMSVHHHTTYKWDGTAYPTSSANWNGGNYFTYSITPSVASLGGSGSFGGSLATYYYADVYYKYSNGELVGPHRLNGVGNSLNTENIALSTTKWVDE